MTQTNPIALLMFGRGDAPGAATCSRSSMRLMRFD